MNPEAILKNRNALIGIGIAAVLIIVMAITFSTKKSGEDSTEVKKEYLKQDVKLLTTTDAGKALEIQALLAREQIPITQEGKGTKIDLVLKKEDRITTIQRDEAIITIVKSGIMDKNIGLEIFDKGDFTSSREDKKIRLARAINGELARLIKKMQGVQDASVFVAIPKDTIFTSMKQPVTATVQIVLASETDKLEDHVIRAIKNLLLGSVENLDAENISITDTNGNVYNSIMSANDDLMKRLEDNDNYMKKKITTQLDKLIGQGNYVVTVSTYLREAPSQTERTIYDPRQSSIGAKQRFSENLGDQSHDNNSISRAVSSHLPLGLRGPDSDSSRNYNRSAEEYNYKVGQTNISELKKPGMLEEISIAVTINNGSMPTGTAIEDLKTLVATAASPKASPTNVQIAFSDKIKPYLGQERPVQLPQPESSGNPWWTVAALLGVLLFIGLVYISGRAKDSQKKHQQEIDSLMEMAARQEKALEESNKRAIAMQEAQQQMYKQISTTQQAQTRAVAQQPIPEITASIEEDVDEHEFATTIKNWIESSS